jgi:hypothetical protein
MNDSKVARHETFYVLQYVTGPNKDRYVAIDSSSGGYPWAVDTILNAVHGHGGFKDPEAALKYYNGKFAVVKVTVTTEVIL